MECFLLWKSMFSSISLIVLSGHIDVICKYCKFCCNSAIKVSGKNRQCQACSIFYFTLLEYIYSVDLNFLFYACVFNQIVLHTDECHTHETLVYVQKINIFENINWSSYLLSIIYSVVYNLHIILHILQLLHTTDKCLILQFLLYVGAKQLPHFSLTIAL